MNKQLLNLSYFDITKKEKEWDYHNVLNGIFLTLNNHWAWKSNREAGNGRFDHSLYNKNTKIGYIFEYKLVNDFNNLSHEYNKAFE